MALDSRQKRAAVIGVARAWYRNPHPSSVDAAQRASIAQAYPVAGFQGVAAPVFSGAIADISLTEATGAHSYDLSAYFTGATSYSISPAVETGWTFDTSTAELVIDTDIIDSFGPYTVTGTNAGGSDVSNAFAVAVLTAESEASGSWWYSYDYEYKARERKKKELEALEAKSEKIQDEVEREIAKELRKQEKEQARIEELRRLKDLAKENKNELKQIVSKRALDAIDQAIIKDTYSSMERMEREIARAREEEIFLMQAASLILNS